MEISNPAMTSRHFFRLTGRRYTLGYEAAEIIFIFLYCFGRIFIGIPLVYSALKFKDNNLFLKFVVSGLMIQSFYFVT